MLCRIEISIHIDNLQHAIKNSHFCIRIPSASPFIFPVPPPHFPIQCSDYIISLYRVPMVVSNYILLTFFEAPQCWPTALQFLPNLQLPQQNSAESGTTKLYSTNPSRWPPWSLCIIKRDSRNKRVLITPDLPLTQRCLLIRWVGCECRGVGVGL